MDDNNSSGIDKHKDPTELSLIGSLADQPMREPLAGAHSHYQSKMFQVNFTVNPLVAAASPLLSLATQLAKSQQTPNFKLLLQSLINEVKALEAKAQEIGYRAPVILAARYLICALIDETILNTDWGKNSRWDQHNLLTHFQKENWGGERFFLLLERSAEEPDIYIDLLELGYICLSLGFQGKYAKTHDYNDLALFIDKLYDTIRHQRGEFSRRLLVAADTIKKKKTTRWFLPPLWLTALITLLILAGIFIPYYISLQNLSKPVNQAIQNIQSLTTKSGE